VFINNANITNYLIPANTAIYTTESEASVYRFGHSLINLKAMSDDNNGATEFIIIDDIHFGFLIDPNMDCCLKTNNGSKIVIDSSTSNLYVTFVVIGRLNNFAGQI
jgi:hypothetical protein